MLYEAYKLIGRSITTHWRGCPSKVDMKFFLFHCRENNKFDGFTRRPDI